jgi:hypothetical protein
MAAAEDDAAAEGTAAEVDCVSDELPDEPPQADRPIALTAATTTSRNGSDLFIRASNGLY